MATDKDQKLKEEIIEICQLMAAGGLVAGTEGNVSGRASDGTVLMTPSGYNKGDVTAEMLVRIDLDGNVVEGDFPATSEKFMHLESRAPDFFDRFCSRRPRSATRNIAGAGGRHRTNRNRSLWPSVFGKTGRVDCALCSAPQCIFASESRLYGCGVERA